MRAGRRRPRDAGRAWPTLDRDRALVPPAPAPSDASGPEVEARVALVADDVGGRPARKAGTSPASRSASGPPPAGGRTREASSSSVPVIVDADHVGGAAHSGALDDRSHLIVRRSPGSRGADGGTAIVGDQADRGRVGHLRHRRHRHLADGSGRQLLAIVRLPGCGALSPGAERRTGREARGQAVGRLMRDGSWCRGRLGVAAVASIGLDAAACLVVLEGDEGAGKGAHVGDRALAHPGDDTRGATACDRPPFVARLTEAPRAASPSRGDPCSATAS